MSGNIRILIVDDVQEGRDMLTRLLSFEPDMEVVGYATTGSEAIEQAVELQPDVILMDINMPDMDGITATEQISQMIATSVVMISVQSDKDYMRRAMRGGAVDFLSKPPSADELYATVRSAYERKPAAKGPLGGAAGGDKQKKSSGKVIVVYSPQGGAGVTSFAVNIAAGIMDEQHRTVLVDADMQFGDAAIHLAVDMERNITNLAQSADDLDTDLIENVLVTHGTGLRVLTAPKSTQDADAVNADALEKIIEALCDRFSYVVVDTSLYLDEIMARLFRIADALVLIGLPTLPAVRNVKEVLTLLNHFEEFDNEKIIFALNRVPTDRKSGAFEPDDIAKALRLEIAAIVPSAEKQMLRSVNRGVPAVVNDSQSPGKEILQLVEVLRRHLSDDDEELVAEPQQEQKRGILGGLFGS